MPIHKRRAEDNTLPKFDAVPDDNLGVHAIRPYSVTDDNTEVNVTKLHVVLSSDFSECVTQFDSGAVVILCIHEHHAEDIIPLTLGVALDDNMDVHANCTYLVMDDNTDAKVTKLLVALASDLFECVTQFVSGIVAILDTHMHCTEGFNPPTHDAIPDDNLHVSATRPYRVSDDHSVAKVTNLHFVLSLNVSEGDTKVDIGTVAAQDDIFKDALLQETLPTLDPIASSLYGWFICDLLLMSTWAVQLHILLCTCKKMVWLGICGTAQMYLVESKWRPGAPPNKKARTKTSPCCYSPGLVHQDSCFYACLAFAITGKAPTRQQVCRARQITVALWAHADPALLHATARRAGFPNAQAYLNGLSNRTWGGLPDLGQWTKLFNAPASMTTNGKRFDLETNEQPEATLRLLLADQHFSVLHSPTVGAWTKLTDILTVRQSKLTKTLEKKIALAKQAKEVRKQGDAVNPDLHPDSTDRASVPHPDCRGGMRRPAALAPDIDDDDETIVARAHLEAIDIAPPGAYLRAVNLACSALAQVMGRTVGYFHLEHLHMTEYALTQTTRTTAPVTVIWLRDPNTRWVVLDVLLRCAFIFGYYVNYLALRESFPGPDSWMWPFPPTRFCTSWAAQSTSHVIIVEHDASAFLVLSRINARRMLQDAQRDRGGSPLLSSSHDFADAKALVLIFAHLWPIICDDVFIADLFGFKYQ
eukprot:6473477-Amphidinium_carterae.1